MRIGFLMGRSFTDRSNVAAVVRLLEQWGIAAKPLHLGDDLIDIAKVRLDYDLYVLKERSDLAMSVAADLHGAGAPLLNPYPVSALLRDRIVTSRTLRAAGVPVPETFVASHVSQLLPALDRGPLVVKPHRRVGKQGIEIVTQAAELGALGLIDEPVFAQRYQPPDGPGRRIYSIGGELFGVLRARTPRTFVPSGELASLVRRCGAAFGIDLFGVDIVESEGRGYVVDMSSFPSFKGVPNAPLHLARYVRAAAERAIRGEPIVPAGGTGAERAASRGSTLDLVLRALSTSPATPQELDQIRKLLDDIQSRSPAPAIRRSAGRRRAGPPAPGKPAPPRVALYSQGMVGFGHIRRNASIAQGLRRSALRPAIVLIAEAWQTGALPLPPGVDCVTLPALRRELDGGYNPRFLVDVSDEDLIALRGKVIRAAVKSFVPDVLIVDHLALGAAQELTRTLARARKRGTTRCVLGLRDVLEDREAPSREAVHRLWSDPALVNAVREYYDAIWIYGDPAVYDPVQEYGLPDRIARELRFTGYLDQRSRLEPAGARAPTLPMDLPPGRLVLCLVGGGHDGSALAEAFLETDLPPDTTGVLVTGPLMPGETRQRILHERHRHSRFQVLEFVPEPALLIERADRVIAMGGYNTVCEVLSFEKHALIVPRVHPEPEQWIRAQRLRDLALLDVLHPAELSPRALTEWLARDLGPPPPSRSRVDLGGLTRIPGLLAELLGRSVPAAQPPARLPASAPGASA